MLEEALGAIFREPVKVAAAGRTDAGVHASGQVVSFAPSAAAPELLPERLALALNALLPADCSVRDAAHAPPGFSARFAARERTYVYAVFQAPSRSALLGRYAYHVRPPLDLEAMRSAGAGLVGRHDFRAFGSTEGGGGTVRTLRRLAVDSRGPLIRIEVVAEAFLRHMVRAIVGALLQCGLGRSEPARIAAALDGANGDAGIPRAPAHGLFLAGVRYDGYDSFAEPPPLREPIPLLDGGRPFP